MARKKTVKPAKVKREESQKFSFERPSATEGRGCTKIHLGTLNIPLDDMTCEEAEDLMHTLGEHVARIIAENVLDEVYGLDAGSWDREENPFARLEAWDNRAEPEDEVE